MALDQEKLVSNDIVCLLPWDSNFFGFPVAQVTSERLTAEGMTRVLEFCRECDVKLLQFKCDAHDRQSILLAEQHGFHFADIRMTFTCKTSNAVNALVKPSKVVFRKAEEHDIESLMAIAEDLYLHSRYYFDINFPRDRVRDFYRDWVRKSVGGEFDDFVYVLSNRGRLVAFCTVKLGRKEASIGLVGVDPQFAGQGFGRKLIKIVLSEIFVSGFGQVGVVTQGRNYSAQRLYQSVGFTMQHLQIYYHRWQEIN